MIGALPRATLLIGEGSVHIRRPNAPCDANERVASVEPAECRAVESGTCDVCLTGRGHSARAANKLYTNNWRLVCLHTPVCRLAAVSRVRYTRLRGGALPCNGRPDRYRSGQYVA